MFMTLKDLRKLCEKMEAEGYEDSVLRVHQNGYYNAVDVELTPNEYGEIVISFE